MVHVKEISNRELEFCYTNPKLRYILGWDSPDLDAYCPCHVATSVLAMDFQFLNQCLQVIAQSLVSKQSGPQPLNHPPTKAQLRNPPSTPSPLGFHNPPPSNNNYHTCSLEGSHDFYLLYILSTSISIKNPNFFHRFLSYSQNV